MTPEFALRVRDRQPPNLDSALAIALQMEVWTKTSRNQPVELRSPVESKKTRKLNQPGAPSQSPEETKNEALRKEVTEVMKAIADNNRIYHTTNNRLNKKLGKRLKRLTNQDG